MKTSNKNSARPFDHFSKRALNGVSLDALAETYGTPLYVYSEDALLSAIERFMTGLKPLNALPCFAVKSCSNLSVLATLMRAGAGADLVSGGELYRALRAGFRADRIVFSGVGKTSQEISEALDASDAGILSFNVESIGELLEIHRVALQKNKVASVSFRFNPDVNPKTHPYIATGLKENKFGLARRGVLEAVALAQTLSHVSIRGLSIHIGSQLTRLAPLAQSFARLRALSAEVAQTLGRPLDWLDVGGGLAIRYDSTPRSAQNATIEQYCALVVKYFGPKTQNKPGYASRILLEPGRIISGNSAVLLTRVLYEKKVTSKPAGKRLWIVDAGMNDLARPSLYGSHHEIAAVSSLGENTGTQKKSQHVLVDVAGPVCESSDVLGKNRKLPIAAAQGGLLALGSAGAYGFSMASQYNSRPRPAEILIRRTGQVEVIRSRETYEDLVRGET